MKKDIANLLDRLDYYKHNSKADLLIEEAITSIKDLNYRLDDRESVIRNIDGALCNYLNQCSDDFEPVELWNEYQHNAFMELCEAYNTWHKDHEIAGKLSMEEYSRNRTVVNKEMIENLTLVLVSIIKENDIKSVKDIIERRIISYQSEI